MNTVAQQFMKCGRLPEKAQDPSRPNKHENIDKNTKT